MSAEDPPPPPPPPPTDEYEWDESRTLTTAWATAAATKRGRRTYGGKGRKGGGGGTSKFAGGFRKKRQQQMMQQTKNEESGGLAVDPSSADVTADSQQRTQRNLAVPGTMDRDSGSQNSLCDSSISSAGSGLDAAFASQGHGRSESIGSIGGKLPPVPRPQNIHGRSHSASTLPGRPPVGQASSLHQRSSSVSGFKNCSPSSSVSNKSGGMPFSSYSPMDNLDRENVHPNVLFPSDRESPMQSTNKAKNRLQSTPLKHQATKSPTRGGGKGRKKKTRTGTTSDDVSVPMSSPISSVSSASFSSLSKTGDIAPTWVMKSLQDATKKFGVPSSLVNRVRSSSSTSSSSMHKRGSSSFGFGSDVGCGNIDLADLNPASACYGGGGGSDSKFSSPARSVAAGSTTSSRKRGVCESPLLDADDAAFSAGANMNSPGRLSTSMHSCSSYRSRSRSRIFSPDSTKKIMAAAANAMCGIDDDFFRGTGTTAPGPASVLSESGRQKRSLFHDSEEEEDSDKSDMDTSNEDLNASSSSSSSSGSKSDDHPVAALFGASSSGTGMGSVSPPPKPYRRSTSENFAQSVFGSVDGPLEVKAAAAATSASGGMASSNNSSPQDMTSSSDTGKEEGSGSNDTDSPSDEEEVVEEDDPLSSVSSYEDLKYLIKALRKWAKGKNLASFGMSMPMIVLPSSWSSARKAAFMRWATSGLGFSLRSGGGSVVYLQTTAARGTDVLTSLEAILIEHKAKEGEAPKKAEKAAGTDAPPLFLVTAPARRAPVSTGIPPRADIFRTVDRDVDTDLSKKISSLEINKSDVPASRVTEGEQEKPFVRSVTLEPSNQDVVQPLVASTLPCFAPMSVSPKDPSLEAQTRFPRHSGEHSIGGLDIMQHIHGISPNDNLRPSRLLMPIRDNVMSPFGETPGPDSCVKMPAGGYLANKTPDPSYDLAETPMPTDGAGFWGSRPIPGKDWGQSQKCEETTIALMLERHDKTFSDSEYCGDSPLPMIVSQTPIIDSVQKSAQVSSSSCFVHPVIQETAVNPSGLGFDLEADNAPRTTELLLGASDNEVEGDCFKDDIEGIRRRTTHEIRFGRSRTSRCYGVRGRTSSVGASAFGKMSFHEEDPSPEKMLRRRNKSLAIHKRMSLCAAAFEAQPSRRNTSFMPLATPFVERTRRELVVAGEDDLTLDDVLNDGCHLSVVFSFLTEEELLISASLVRTSWGEAATAAHASLMLVSVGCSTAFVDGESAADECDLDDDDDVSTDEGRCLTVQSDSVAKSMERSWNFLTNKFPWAAFLSEGAFKRVYRVWNSTVEAEEAVSVMDVNTIESMGNKDIVGAELSVSVLLSSLVRRNVCPNFVVTRGVFTCPYEPPSSHWGCSENKKPKGSVYRPDQFDGEEPSEPDADCRGKYQYIRMELCRHGDIEEFLKDQPNQSIGGSEARMLLFQMAFALHTAADRYSMKHYDVKLLNFFLQSANDDGIDAAEHPYTALRFGIGSHVFSLRMPTSRALIAKLADYGTANIRPESNGQPVTIGQFTTIENSPPDYLLSGDAAKQGFGHDCFGLGLCMLHLFTGQAPYEEILEDVVCPTALKRKLRNIWENKSSTGYDVIRSLILADVYEDEDGNTEGERDEVLYDTLYRYLVLFGIPEKKLQFKEGARVWRAIVSALVGQETKPAAPARRSRRNITQNNESFAGGPDTLQFEKDQKLYSLAHGSDPRIAAARGKLTEMNGGMDLLLSLVSFDPSKRATPLDVINSEFMASLREDPGVETSGQNDLAYSYMHYLTR